MKKIILNGFLGLSLLFSACNPYEDIQNELKDDLALMTENEVIPSEISLDETYATVEEAESRLQVYLTETYPKANKYTEGSVVEVEYNLGLIVDAPNYYVLTEDDYKSVGNEFCSSYELWNRLDGDAAATATEITLNHDDYDLVGSGKYDNFAYYDDRAGEFPEGTSVDNILDAKIDLILKTNYPSENGEVKVSYQYYNDGSTNTVVGNYKYEAGEICEYYFLGDDNIEEKVSTILAGVYSDKVDGTVARVDYSIEGSDENDFFEKNGSNWTSTYADDYYVLTADDYDSMGAPGKYDNFSSSTLQENYLPQFLTIKYPYAQAEQSVVIIYKYYSGGASTETVEYTFDGSVWLQTAPLNTTVKETSKFKYTDGAWVVSKATVIILTEDDYTLVGSGQYFNFAYYDNEAGEFPEGTQVDNILVAKIIKILTENYPALNVVDAEVIVHFTYYDNGTNVVNITFTFDGSSWSILESSIKLD